MVRLQLTCETTHLTSRIISWTIEPTSENLSLYVLDLYKSEQSKGNFDSLVSGLNLNTVYQYADTIVSGLTYFTNRLWWYSGVVRNISTGETLGVSPVSLIFEPNIIGQEIIRRKSYALEPRYGGLTFWHLKRKTFGTNCSCWDDILQRNIRDRCLDCYDTAWSGGYYAPVLAKCSLDIGIGKNQLTLWGDWQPNDANLFLTNEPELSTRDILVDSNNDRWRVLQINGTEKNGAIISQLVHIRRLLYDDIIYEFPVSGLENA